MTGLAESTRALDPPAVGEDSPRTEPMPLIVPVRGARQWLRPIGGWRGFGWLLCGVAGGVAIAWYIFRSPGEVGSKAEWFFGAVVFCVVLVSMWQTVNIQRQANQNAAEAAERHRRDLAIANERTAAELAHMQSVHRAEMEAQRELARVERIHLVNQLQKQAMIEVSRSVGEHTHMLATLWNQSVSILAIEDRDEREQAMSPIFEQITQTVNDFSVELANAHLLVDDDRLHDALNRVNEAALMAIQVAEEVHVAVVDGHAPEPNPIPPVQLSMHARAAEARRLAWDLVRAGLNDSEPQQN